jgi:tetratricopeptide (TPR) repeat protein
MFFANRSWFYNFAQAALLQNTERRETEKMEIQLGERIKQKGWEVKLINDEESRNIKGDVDIFVKDNDTLLFIQLKRTYFRLNIKDSYKESIKTDKKAAEQLNEAEESLLQENSICKITNKPIKWIVSTSFENVGKKINGCMKINYFEFINAINNPLIKTISDLIKELETDKNLKRFITILFDEKILADERLKLADIISPLATFKSNQYKKAIFSEEEKKTEEYNIFFNKAITLDAEGKKKEALDIFNKCISLKPNDVEAHEAMANTLADLKDYNNSFNSFKKALDLSLNDPHVTRNYFLALFEAGKCYDSLSFLISFLEKFPLLVEMKRIFEIYFDQSLKNGQLTREQILELQTKWNNLYK